MGRPDGQSPLPHRALGGGPEQCSRGWDEGSLAALGSGRDSVVTWTLTPTSTGTHLRMEQSGFRPDQQQAYQGAKGGWPQFFAALEQVLARIEKQPNEVQAI
ncbi:MAG TPA: SRPBCC domain-containing protein [Steroidobacteraceae bacterium]|nr:SRPBCC domain-containing protein [Steroidobacteraceae bacterium]